MNSNQNVLITGAVGRIGSSLALLLAKNSYNLYLVDILGDELNSLAVSLASEYDVSVFCSVCDLSSIDSIDKLLSDFRSSLGLLHSVVHCAYPKSLGWGTDFENLNPNFLYQDLSTQLGGSILLAQRVLSVFKNQSHGNLVLLSSIQGLGSPKFSHYSGTSMTSPIEYTAIKAGIIAITKWLAGYFKNSNIRINCVSPGGIYDSQPKVFVENYRESCSNIGLLSADHVSSVILFLISIGSEAITGQNIVVDDGWSL